MMRTTFMMTFSARSSSTKFPINNQLFLEILSSLGTKIFDFPSSGDFEEGFLLFGISFELLTRL